MAEELSFLSILLWVQEVFEAFGKCSGGGKKGDGSFNKVWRNLQIICAINKK